MKRFRKDAGAAYAQVQEAADRILQTCTEKPVAGLILGTGLGSFSDRLEEAAAISYSDIPHFPVSTVESHSGRICLGKAGGLPVILMDGRFHFYEGYSLSEVTFGVRVMKQLGAGTLIVTNAAGGLNPAYRKGELVLIEDHINFMGVNPLVGPNEDRWGPRFPDMAEPYSARLFHIAREAARKAGITVREGVYVGVTGPCLETRAEYRMMRGFGADLVGMSTVPEVITGVHCGMSCLGISVVTDLCDPDHLKPVDIREIIRTAGEAGPRLDKLVMETLKNLKASRPV